MSKTNSATGAVTGTATGPTAAAEQAAPALWQQRKTEAEAQLAALAQKRQRLEREGAQAAGEVLAGAKGAQLKLRRRAKALGELETELAEARMLLAGAKAGLAAAEEEAANSNARAQITAVEALLKKRLALAEKLDQAVLHLVGLFEEGRRLGEAVHTALPRAVKREVADLGPRALYGRFVTALAREGRAMPALRSLSSIADENRLMAQTSIARQLESESQAVIKLLQIALAENSGAGEERP